MKGHKFNFIFNLKTRGGTDHVKVVISTRSSCLIKCR